MQNGRLPGSESPGKELAGLLASEIDLSERLLAVIAREKLLMEQPLAADAEDLLQHKLALLQELQETSALRLGLLQRHGFEASAAGMASCSRACSQTPGLDKAFQRLRELARECHEANQRLGLMLNRKAGFFARLLSGVADGGEAPLYQSNGQRDPAAVNLRHRLRV